MYYVIHNTADGVEVDELLSEEDLEECLTEGYYGNVDILNRAPNMNANLWGNNILIIKGNVVPGEVAKNIMLHKA